MNRQKEIKVLKILVSKFKNKILLQAIKEFKWPFASAIIWALFNLYVGDNNHQNFNFIKSISSFVASFFFISWGFAQYFRIAKQNKVENSFDQIESKTIEILKKLELASQELVGNITGGDSFIYLLVNVDGTSTFVQIGNYLVHETSVRLCDLEEFGRIHKAGLTSYPFSSDTFFQVPALLPQHCVKGPNFELKNKNKFYLNLFYTSRNGAFGQAIRMTRVNGGWSIALQVKDQKGNEIYRMVHPNFPLNSSGLVDWDEMP